MLAIQTEKLMASILRFQVFLNVMEKTKWLPTVEIKKQRRASEALMVEIRSGACDHSQALEAYNQMVTTCNAKSAKPLYPPLDSRTIEDLLRSEILAFEMVINGELNAGLLSARDQNAAFEKALKIWETVKMGAIPECLFMFSNLIKKTNNLLPPLYHYPIPDQKEYPKL